MMLIDLIFFLLIKALMPLQANEWVSLLKSGYKKFHLPTYLVILRFVLHQIVCYLLIQQCANP